MRSSVSIDHDSLRLRYCTVCKNEGYVGKRAGMGCLFCLRTRMQANEYIPAPPGVNEPVADFAGFDPASSWDHERNRWYKLRVQGVCRLQQFRRAQLQRRGSGVGSTMTPIPEGIEPPVTAT